MSETIQFNKGTINITKSEIVWEIPTREVQCISTNELNYLKDQHCFSIPVNQIDLDKENLIFTWDISKDYQPISSVKKADIWFQLKAAKSLLTLVKYFDNHNELYTVYDQANFYVDKNYHVKVIVLTKETHLPHHKNPNKHMDFIKKLLMKILSKNNNNESFIEKIKQSDEVNELKEVVDDQYHLFLSTLDEERTATAKLIKRTKVKYLLVSITVFIVALLAIYFFTGENEQIKALEDDYAELETRLDIYEDQVTSFNAYFSGNTEEALKIINDLQENKETEDVFSEQYYMNLLIESGEIKLALEKFPKESYMISDQYSLNAEDDEMLSLQTDDPYIKFEQAVIKDEPIDDIVPQLNKLTDRQKNIIFDYYKNNNLDQAIEFANEQENTNWLIESLEIKKEKLEKDIKKLDKKKEKKEIETLKDEIKEISDQLESLS